MTLNEFDSATESAEPALGSFRSPCGASSSTARSPRLAIILLVVVYVPLALTFSLLTPAFQGDDEGAHTQYIEYIMSHHSIPRIGTASSESQQPPAYYLLAAGWQHLLAIPPFTPQFSIAKDLGPGKWTVSRSRTPAEHQGAVYAHELRLLSILLGLGTVLLAYATARVLKLRESLCLACGLAVALLPRELVVSSNVTNDALAIPLCALALVLFLLSENARREGRFRRRRIDLGVMGLTLGLAAATKLTTLPIAGILLILAAVPSVRVDRRTPASSTNAGGMGPRALAVDGRRLLDAALAAIGFLATSGWWFVRNKELYGQFLASNSSEKSLGVFAHPVPWTAHLFFVELPRVLWQSTWYAQLLLELPNWMNDVLALLAVVCLVVGAWVVLARPMQMSVGLQGLSGVALLGCMVGGLVAEVFHIKTTSIGDSRLAFVCLTASAVVLIAGSTRIASRINIRLWPVGLFAWPVIFLLLDVYVLLRFLVPLGGL